MFKILDILKMLMLKMLKMLNMRCHSYIKKRKIINY